MSLKSRARRIAAQLPFRSYQLILQDIQRLRMRGEHEERYIEAWKAAHTPELACEECGEDFPIAMDNKGYSDEAGRRYCDACVSDHGISGCIRCGCSLLGEDREDFCASCQDYYDRQ